MENDLEVSRQLVFYPVMRASIHPTTRSASCVPGTGLSTRDTKMSSFQFVSPDEMVSGICRNL